MMQEGKLLHREVVTFDGKRYYVGQVQFPDFHKSIHGFYVNMDHILEGKTIVAQRSDYNDFCNFTAQLEDYTITMLRQVERIILVRSFEPMSVDVFDRATGKLLK